MPISCLLYTSSEQAHKLQHASNLYYTAPCGKLAKKLCKRTGMSNVFFGNSGAEANEGAIKAARKYSFDKYGADRYNVITLVNSFHGRTIATLTATGQEVCLLYTSRLEVCCSLWACSETASAQSRSQ